VQAFPPECVVDFRSGWALCCCRYVRTTLSHRAKLPGGVRWAASLALLAPGSHLWR